MKRWIRRLTVGVLGLAALWCLAGFLLALWPVDGFADPEPGSSPTAAGGQPGEDSAAIIPPPADTVPVLEVDAADGTRLVARSFPGDADVTVLLLHGVLSEARMYDSLAARIRDRSGASVLSLDLRGHGASDGEPGDVAYIGQYGHDIGDVIDALRSRQPRGRVVLAGYSMGGGIVLRYAERASGPSADGYLLLAPLMGPDSPTTRTEGGDPSAEAFMKLHLKRLIGLTMLNAIGIRVFNSLQTLVFDVPSYFPVRAYTYRAMVGMTPASHVAALAADSLPLFALVGSRDPVFHVDRFPAVIAQHANGSTEVVEGADHDTLVDREDVAAKAAAWLRAVFP